mmetsp:Transcript_29090/g.41602  ORF Transcript_29090/g.41602 Transcript_29090/m.41602 type:complete len:298 (+) Transcript_29090:135-1028(+)
MMIKGGRQRRHAGALFTCCILCFITATHAWMTPRMNSNRLSMIQLSKDDSEESSTTLDFVSIEDAGSSSKFGDFIPLHKAEDEMDNTQQGEGIITSQNLSDSSTDELEMIKKNKLRNVIIAVSSFAFAIANYCWQLTHPVTAVSILVSMENKSAPLTSIGNNGKPTVIDFWAPWCSNCKVAAPTLQAVEKQYGDSVNFIMVNGDDGKNWPLIQLFGVDAIPHLALLSDEGDVETALIGPMSRNVLRADLDALLTKRDNCEAAPVCHEELPYKMYDAFSTRDRRINFVKAMEEMESRR